ncbi:MAG: TonB-dependent receptor [Candidatus Coatesbacteria bacterium]|nr:TonB-dependent receptor [Candidatus Coatesbacteria bacterium]
MNFRKSLLIVFGLTIFVTGLLFASSEGKITGVVTDSSGPVAGAYVSVKSGEYEDAAITGPNGRFSIVGVPVGVYTVTATAPQRTKSSQSGVQVSADRTVTVNFTLRSAGSGSAIHEIVVYKPKMVVKDRTETVRQVRDEDIKDQPMVTDLADVVSKQAGATTQGGELRLRGGRAGEITYLIDGMSVKDPLQTTGGTNLELGTNSINEVSVSSGGFGAEYGNAQSGIVNVVTKTGGDRNHGEISFQTDDFGFGGQDMYNGHNYYNSDRIEISDGGPFPFLSAWMKKIGIADRFTYFASFTGEWNDGRLWTMYPYPRNRYKIGPFTVGDRANNTTSGNAKLLWKFTPKHTLTLGYRKSFNSYRPTSQGAGYLWTQHYEPGDSLPNGRYASEEYWAALHTYTGRRWSDQQTINWTHSLASGSAYYNVILGRFNTKFIYDVDGKIPPEYILPDQGSRAFSSVEGFECSGDNELWLKTISTTYSARWDLTKEFTKSKGKSTDSWSHTMRTGLEGNYYELDYKYVDLMQFTPGREVPGEWPEYGQYREFYFRTPWAGAYYLQDKMEYEGMIVNAGLRFDIYTPGKQLAKMTETSGGQEVPVLEDEYQWTLSPRVGVSHPITENDILRFAYGHYTEIPDFTLLYRSRDITGSVPLLGNPNLRPEKTTSYEAGLEHQFSENVMIGLTGFYKDIKDLIDTEKVVDPPFTYTEYVNRDFGSVRGFELSLNKRYSNYVAGFISYSLSWAMGNSSDSRQGYDNAYNNLPNPVKEQALDWDQRHTVNLNLSLSAQKGMRPKVLGVKFPDLWGISLSWEYGSGYPYTPSTFATGEKYPEENSRRMPWTSIVNMMVYKGVAFLGMNYRLFLEGYNIFDQTNTAEVNANTGKAWDPTDAYQEDFLWNKLHPMRFMGRRQLQIGMSLEW